MVSFVSIPNTTLLREINSRGLVETDRAKAEEYKIRSKILNGLKTDKQEIDALKDQVVSISQDISDIKTLLQELVRNK